MALMFRWVTFLLMTLVASCGGGGESGVGAADVIGSARLARAGAPSCGYAHVYVTVEKVRIYQGAASKAHSGVTEVTLPSPRRIDLVGLTSGVLEELGTAPLPAGHYTEVRLILAANGASGSASMANAVQPTGGSLTPLSTLSAQQSGLKLQANFDVAAGQMADLIFDSDPCQLVNKAGNSGKYLLNPVIAVRPLAVTLVDNSEHRVNTTTPGAQVQPDAARLNDGGYVIVWASPGREGSSIGIYAQRYWANGTPLGGETRISTNAATDQVLPAAAGLADGGYVITWASLDSSGSGAGRGLGIYARRFAADGTPMGTEPNGHGITGKHRGMEQQVNTVSMLEQSAPHVAGLAGGGYVVTWRFVQDTGPTFPGSIPGVFARRYTAAGAAAGPEQVLMTQFFALMDSAITALSDGGYVVALSWTGKVYNYVATQRFDAGGVSVGGRQVSQTGGSPAITALKDGCYLVIWRSWDGFIHAQRYAADDSPLGAEVRMDPSVGQSELAVATLDDGGYVVTWAASQGDASGEDVYARRYAADGSTVGGVTRINTTTASDQQSPAIAAAGAGGFVVTWMSLNQDGDSWGIYARQFDAEGLR